ncbi:MAG: hypothetical protein JSW50_14900 [Candidatus Latescibacterota bacterium]|nr:MAG: hypothetical protein JSW50_14900 [Candidatus Latescibacterota bacterium]
MNKPIWTCVMLLLFVSLANAQTIVRNGEFDPEAIESELMAKYNAFNGRLEDQTVELWDTYFLKSPNIGNMHEGRPEIGWETVHKGTIEFVKSKPAGEMMMENLEFYPINSNTAWVKGKMVITVTDRVIRADFYDSLVKTVEGWRVILSVVTPERS